MSFSKKIVTTYSKSLFEAVKDLQKSNKISTLNESLDTIKKFEISKITSATEKQSEDFITVFSIGEELSMIRSLLLSSRRIQALFKNPTIPESQKLDLVYNIFPGLTVIARCFLKILTEKSHLSLLPEIMDEYDDYLFKFQNLSKIKLITSSILLESYGSLLFRTLKAVTKSKEVILNVAYNPQLLGGLILEYNSSATDASILKEFSLFFAEI